MKFEMFLFAVFLFLPIFSGSIMGGVTEVISKKHPHRPKFKVTVNHGDLPLQWNNGECRRGLTDTNANLTMRVELTLPNGRTLKNAVQKPLWKQYFSDDSDRPCGGMKSCKKLL